MIGLGEENIWIIVYYINSLRKIEHGFRFKEQYLIKVLYFLMYC